MFADTERELLQQLLEDFKLVFDQDWGYTEAVIKDQSFAPVMISPRGTFLNPAVEDESNRWASRGGLLESYRELISYLKEHELIDPDF